jgi:hypothetical protein
LRWLVRHGALALLSPAAQEGLLDLRKRLLGRSTPSWRPRLNQRLETLLAERRRRFRQETPRHGPADRTAAFATLYSARHASARESMNLLSASSGIECRDPLSAAALVEFCFRTPEWTRMDGAGFRLVQRLALKGLIPEAVRERQDKAEFSATLRRHMLDIEVYEGRLIPKYTTRWLLRSDISDVMETASAQASYGMEKWFVWGLFGSAVVANERVE